MEWLFWLIHENLVVLKVYKKGASWKEYSIKLESNNSWTDLLSRTTCSYPIITHLRLAVRRSSVDILPLCCDRLWYNKRRSSALLCFTFDDPISNISNAVPQHFPTCGLSRVQQWILVFLDAVHHLRIQVASFLFIQSHWLPFPAALEGSLSGWPSLAPPFPRLALMLIWLQTCSLLPTLTEQIF